MNTYRKVNQSYKKAMAIEAKNKKRLLEANKCLDERSGIYFLTRTDENGINYAYIGQAKHILTRLAQHMSGYQHIDLSLKKHGLKSNDNPYGWEVYFAIYPLDSLDEWEQYWIRQYAANGYQLRNKTAGGQGEGKVQIDEYRPAKGYREGVEQGRKQLAKELSHIIEKHLKIEIKEGKEHNKISLKAFEKFNDLLKVGD